MIDHMQNGNGTPFRDLSLDAALKEQILSDYTEKNSTRLLLRKVLNENIDWRNKLYPAEKKDDIRKFILDGRLPKFDRFQDNFNGMGITVHDTWATDITINHCRSTMTVIARWCITKYRITSGWIIMILRIPSLTGFISSAYGLSSNDSTSLVSSHL